MNCDELDQRWPEFLADALDPATLSELVQHAKSCETCEPRWLARQELDTTVGTILEAHKTPTSLADDVAVEVFQERFGAAISREADVAATYAAIGGTDKVAAADLEHGTVDCDSERTGGAMHPIGQQRAILILTAVTSAVIGYVIGGSGGSGPSSVQQMINLQRIYGGRGGNPLEAMLMSEMLGGGSGRGPLPAISSTVQVICLAILLVWVTRNRFWQYLFPARIPLGIQVAKWLALLTAMLGLARCFCIGMVSMTMWGQMQRGVGDMSWIAATVSFVDQLWSISFWITLLVIVLACVDQFLKVSFENPPAKR